MTIKEAKNTMLAEENMMLRARVMELEYTIKAIAYCEKRELCPKCADLLHTTFHAIK